MARVFWVFAVLWGLGKAQVTCFVQLARPASHKIGDLAALSHLGR